MWNIEFKGKIKGDIEQISSGEPLPEGSVPFVEPDSSDKAFALGLLFAVPILLLMIVLAIIRILNVYGKPSVVSFESFIIPQLIALVLLFLFQYIHEYIHAFLFPKYIKKQIYVMPENKMLFVYCEDCITKKNFIIVLLGPAVLLGILPYVTWLAFAQNFSFLVTFSIIMYSLGMVASAVGDYLNVYNTIRQVPKDGKVFNRGFHSYWIQ